MKKKRVFRGMGVIGFIVVIALAIGFFTVPKDNVSDKMRKNAENLTTEDRKMLESVIEGANKSIQNAMNEAEVKLKEEKLEKETTLKQESLFFNQVVAKASKKEYTLKIVLEKGKIVSDKLSPYYGMYEGKFHALIEKDGKIVSDVLCFPEDVVTYFPKEFELYLSDYNGDGLDDFALGQKLGSNYMEYQFFSVMKNGKLRQLLIDMQGAKGEKTLITSDTAYSPAFSKTTEAAGEEKQQIRFKEYQMDKGRYIEKEAALHFQQIVYRR